MSGCGTSAGYQAHRKLREAPCNDCKRGHADYIREFRKRKPEVVRDSTKAAKTRRQALTRLAHRHSEEYDEIYRELLLRNLA